VKADHVKIKKSVPFGTGIERTQSVFEHSTFEPVIVAGSLHIASYGELRDLIPGAFYA
jgi:hypothetical protein